MVTTQPLLHSGAGSRLASVLQHFPPVTYAFAYGSGAHHQPGLYDETEYPKSSATITSQPVDAARHPSPADASLGSRPAAAAAAGHASDHRLVEHSRSTGTAPVVSTGGGRGSGPVIDFIFAVPEARAWHEQNLQRNPDHYSWVGRLGANVVCGIADAVGVGVHFNPLVPLDPQTTVKYGVIEAAALAADLGSWQHLYVAGRMQKPVTPLLPPPPALAAAQLANTHNALAAALVLLPPSFTEEELLRMVAGLSYRGDVRLLVGAEDPHKVARIVDGSWDELYDMYLPLLAGSQRYSPLGVEAVGETVGGGRGCRLWRQSKDTEAQGAALRLLPPGLLQEMATRLGFHVPLSHVAPGADTQQEVVAAVLRAGRPQRLTADSLAAIVRRSSIYQAAAGLLTAGGGKAVQYLAAKAGKAMRPLLAATARGARKGRSS